MRVRATAAMAALLLAALTACGGGDTSDKTDSASKPKAAPSAPTAEEQSTEPEAPKEIALGDPAETTGDGGTGVLQITPDTIVFVKEASGETAANGVFAVITRKVKAMTAVAADEPAPITGGGWSWIAEDGEQVGPDVGNAFNVTMDKYNNADPVQPGTYQWRAEVFDLTEAQAKGGTLLYTDGEGTAFRWKMPDNDSGPNVAEVQKQLEF